MVSGAGDRVMASDVELIRLDPERLEEAAGVLGRATVNDPIFVYCLPDRADRDRGVPLVMQAFLRLGLMHGEVWTTPDPIRGVAWWIPANIPALSRERVESAGVMAAASQWGDSGSARFQTFVADVGEVTAALADRPHWHLSWIGVEPASQGTGLGSMLMRHLLSRVDADEAECDLYDFVPENVPLYEHFDFRVQTDSILPRSGLRLWHMVRPSRGPSPVASLSQ